MAQKDYHSFLQDFTLGCFSAAASRTAYAPVERIRILIQTQNEIIRFGHLDRPYLGFIDCWRRIVAQEGALALWRGNLPDVIRIFPGQILNFVLKDTFKQWFHAPPSSSYSKKFAANIAAGAAAGAVSLSLLYPLDYARTRLAADVKSPNGYVFNGLTDVFKKTLKSDGIRGLYRGYLLSLSGVVVYRGLYFGLYDSLKPLLSPLPKNSGGYILGSFALGWGITLGAGLAAYPLDTVRRRMMLTSCEPVQYKSSLHAFGRIIQLEGPKALFKGAGIKIATAVVGAALLAGYDQLQIYLFPKSPYIGK
eukprot:Phypoly_transcript_12922.p1 GENE.Phypoly_transcript_12922~~Phypoly_transcript_12922.p1  ORF type:complete len:307 (+),score=43.29 Phypoly_transcript_12922:150-1070(+)